MGSKASMASAAERGKGYDRMASPRDAMKMTRKVNARRAVKAMNAVRAINAMNAVKAINAVHAINATNVMKGARTMRTADHVADDQSSVESRPSRGVMALIACGAAVGAAGALVARRRNRAKWADYEPSRLESEATSMLHPSSTASVSTLTETAKPAPGSMGTGAKGPMSGVKRGGDRGGKGAGRLPDRSEEPADASLDDLLRPGEHGSR